MGCTIQGHKIFLVVCNVGLLFTGFTFLTLGIKMQNVLSLLTLTEIPAFLKAANAVIASGTFISVTGATGFCGVCFELLWLLHIHLGGLGTIIAMEFAVGITLMVVKNMIETFMESEECGHFCVVTLQAMIKNLAIPSVGILMTVIILQALMIYSAVQLYYYLRYQSKISALASGPTVVFQNMQMQNVGSQPPSTQPPQPVYPPPRPMQVSPHPEYCPSYSPGYIQSQTEHGHNPTQRPPQQPYSVIANQHQPPHYSDNRYINPPPYAEVYPQDTAFHLQGTEGTIVQRVIPPGSTQAVQSGTAVQ